MYRVNYQIRGKYYYDKILCYTQGSKILGIKIDLTISLFSKK